jgi:hypothetical protein
VPEVAETTTPRYAEPEDSVTAEDSPTMPTMFEVESPRYTGTVVEFVT